MKLRVLIADDELLARERLRELLQVEPGVEIVGECADGLETLKTVQMKRPDVVFLDVRMPELDGFGVIRSLKLDRLPAIVFVTAHDQYTLNAFEVYAVDYLLKPFDRQRFQKALGRAREIVHRGREHHALGAIADSLAALKAHPKPLERLAIKSGGRVVFVKPDEIGWIRSADNYSELHTGKAVHLVRQTLAELEIQLIANRFIRISRSLIVHLDGITELRPKSHGDYIVILRDGTRLSASRSYRDRWQRLLDTKDRVA